MFSWPVFTTPDSHLSGFCLQLRSPQLRQAAGSLSGALDTVNSPAVFTNFGLNPADGDAAMAAGDGVGALIAAIQAAADRARESAGDGSAPQPPQ
jgi:hypothetical protein